MKNIFGPHKQQQHYQYSSPSKYRGNINKEMNKQESQGKYLTGKPINNNLTNQVRGQGVQDLVNPKAKLMVQIKQSIEMLLTHRLNQKFPLEIKDHVTAEQRYIQHNLVLIFRNIKFNEQVQEHIKKTYKSASQTNVLIGQYKYDENMKGYSINSTIQVTNSWKIVKAIFSNQYSLVSLQIDKAYLEPKDKELLKKILSLKHNPSKETSQNEAEKFKTAIQDYERSKCKLQAKIQELSRTCETLKEEVAQKEKENNQLIQLNQQIKWHGQRLKIRLKQNQNQNEKKVSKCKKEAEAQICRLKEEAILKQKEIEKIQQEKEKLVEQLEKLKKQKMQIQKRVKQFEDENLKHNQQKETVKHEHERQKAVIEQFQRSKTKWQANIKVLSNKHDVLLKEIDKREKENNQMIQLNQQKKKWSEQQLEIKLQQNEKKVSKCKKETEAQICRLKEEAELEQKEVYSIQQEKEKLIKQLEKLKKQTIQVQKCVKQFQHVKKQLNDQIDRKASRDKELANSIDARSSFQKTIKKLTLENKQFTEQLKTNKQTNDILTKKVTKLSSIQKQLITIKDEEKKVKEQNYQKAVEIQQLKIALKKSDQQIKGLSLKINDLKKEAKNVNAEQQQKLQSQQTIIEDLQHIKEEKTWENNNLVMFLQDERIKCQQETNRLKKVYEEYDIKNKSQSETRQKQEIKYNKLHDQYQSLLSEKSILQQKQKKLRQDYAIMQAERKQSQKNIQNIKSVLDAKQKEYQELEILANKRKGQIDDLNRQKQNLASVDLESTIKYNQQKDRCKKLSQENRQLDNILAEKIKELDYLNTTKADLELQRSQLITQKKQDQSFKEQQNILITTIKKDNETLNISNTQLKDKKAELESQIKQLKENLRLREQNNLNMIKIIESLKKKLDDLNSQKNVQVDTQKVKKEDKPEVFEKPNIQVDSQMIKITQDNKELKSQYSKLQRQNKKMFEEKEILKTKLKTKEKELEEYIQRFQKVNKDYKDLMQELQNVDSQNHKLELKVSLQRNSSEEEIKTVKDIIKKKQAQMQSERAKYLKDLQEKDDIIQKLREQLKDLQQNHNQLQKSTKDMSEQLLSNKNEVQSVKKQFKIYKEKQKLAHSQILPQLEQKPEQALRKSRSMIPVEQEFEVLEQRQQVQRQLSIIDVRYLFHGDVLRGRDDYKLFLKESIEKLTKVRIIDTVFLHRFDSLNTVNVHRYIDLKQQIVLVVRLINGFCIAGYYEGAFKPKTLANKEGLIISLTNSKCYSPLEKNKRATVYDDYFVIFGNSQIRIKSQQKKVFSNFGLNSSYYKHKGDNVSVLLGCGPNQREVDFDCCEFFQLVCKK